MLTRAERRIKKAWKAGVILVVLSAMASFIPLIKLVNSDALVEELVYAGIGIGIYVVLLFGLRKKNRAASVLLFSYLLINTAGLILLPEEESDPVKAMLSRFTFPFELLEIALFGYFFFNGIRGTFEYHKQMKSKLFSYPSDPISCYNQSMIYRQNKEYENALRYCDAALAIKPDMAYAWQNKGKVLEKLGKYEDALSCFDKCLAVTPQNVDALYSKGLILMQLGKFAEAIGNFDVILAKNSELGEAWFQRARAKASLGAKDDALVDLKQAIELNNPQFSKLTQSDSILSALNESENIKVLNAPQKT